MMPIIIIGNINLPVLLPIPINSLIFISISVENIWGFTMPNQGIPCVFSLRKACG
jgi:hypothetical protein